MPKNQNRNGEIPFLEREYWGQVEYEEMLYEQSMQQENLPTPTFQSQVCTGEGLTKPDFVKFVLNCKQTKGVSEMPLFRKMRRDTVISSTDDGDLVGVYLADDPENLLLECSPAKADAILAIWNNRDPNHWERDYRKEEQENGSM